jgi:hypothetical protein
VTYRHCFIRSLLVDFLTAHYKTLVVISIGSFFFYSFSYVCHLIEQTYQFVESKVDSKVETYFNIQACQNESLATELSEVKATLAELNVRQEEEADGRINEGYLFLLFTTLCMLSLTLPKTTM